MGANMSAAPVSKAALWAGRILSAVVALLLLLDGVMKLFKPAFVVEGTTKLGYSEAVIIPLGIALTASVILYVIPRTSILGAILLTGYLGGAVDAHVHAGDWLNILFPVVFGMVVWGGLVLRDARLRTLLPLRRQTSAG